MVHLFLFLFLFQLVQEAAVKANWPLMLLLALAAVGVGAAETALAQVGIIVHGNTRSAADAAGRQATSRQITIREGEGRTWHGVEIGDERKMLSLEVQVLVTYSKHWQQYSTDDAQQRCIQERESTGWVSLSVRNKSSDRLAS